MQETWVQSLGWEDPPEKGKATHSSNICFPGGSDGKDSPEIRETWIWSLDWEDPLEKEMETHSNTLAWKILWTEEPGML